MTKVISVSIPEELFARLAPWKDELNISSIFREKLEDVLSSKERFKKEITQELDMQEILDRWNKEDSQDDAAGYDAGLKEGLEWAKDAPKKDVLSVIAKLPYYGELNDPFEDDVLKYYLEDCRANDEDLGYEMESNGLPPFNAYTEGWFKGFFEAVEKFYDEVQSAINKRKK